MLLGIRSNRIVLKQPPISQPGTYIHIHSKLRVSFVMSDRFTGRTSNCNGGFLVMLQRPLPNKAVFSPQAILTSQVPTDTCKSHQLPRHLHRQKQNIRWRCITHNFKHLYDKTTNKTILGDVWADDDCHLHRLRFKQLSIRSIWSVSDNCHQINAQPCSSIIRLGWTW